MLISDDTRSLCMFAATPVEMYYMLKEYLENHDAPDHILFSLSPFHFERMGMFWERTVKYKMLSSSDFSELFSKADEMDDPVFGCSSSLKLAAVGMNFKLWGGWEAAGSVILVG